MTQKIIRSLESIQRESNQTNEPKIIYLFIEKNYQVLHISEQQKYVNLCFQYMVCYFFAAITAANRFL